MKSDRYFYSSVAALFVALMFVGFFAFYTRGTGFGGRVITPEVRGVVIVHGIATTIWYLLFLAQTLLIATRNRRAHMTLGWSAVVVGLTVSVSGVLTAVRSVRFTPPEFVLFGMKYQDFLLVMLMEITVFTVFVAAGILMRKRAEIHRPMMVLASLSLLLGATARMPYVMALFGGENTRGGFFGPVFTLAAIILVARWAMTRRFDRVYAAGYAATVILYLGAEQLSRTQAWHQIALALIKG